MCIHVCPRVQVCVWGGGPVGVSEQGGDSTVGTCPPTPAFLPSVVPSPRPPPFFLVSGLGACELLKVTVPFLPALTLPAAPSGRLTSLRPGPNSSGRGRSWLDAPAQGRAWQEPGE